MITCPRCHASNYESRRNCIECGCPLPIPEDRGFSRPRTRNERAADRITVSAYDDDEPYQVAASTQANQRVADRRRAEQERSARAAAESMAAEDGGVDLADATERIPAGSPAGASEASANASKTEAIPRTRANGSSRRSTRSHRATGSGRPSVAANNRRVAKSHDSRSSSGSDRFSVRRSRPNRGRNVLIGAVVALVLFGAVFAGANSGLFSGQNPFDKAEEAAKTETAMKNAQQEADAKKEEQKQQDEKASSAAENDDEKAADQQDEKATDQQEDTNNTDPATDANADEESEVYDDPTQSADDGDANADAGDNDAAAANVADQYVLPDSSEKAVTDSQLSGLSDWDLYVARNEIYARHGRSFDDPDLRKHFEGTDWYSEEFTDSEFDDVVDMLSDRELANVKAIMKYEKDHKSKYASRVEDTPVPSEPAKSSSGSSSGSSSSSKKSTSSKSSKKSTTAKKTTTPKTTKGYILPKSNDKYYTTKQIKSMSNWELCLARNEIYARHGREFTNKKIQDYFNKQSWYKPRYSANEFDKMASPLNKYENKNAITIRNLEKSRNSKYLN